MKLEGDDGSIFYAGFVAAALSGAGIDGYGAGLETPVV